MNTHIHRNKTDTLTYKHGEHTITIENFPEGFLLTEKISTSIFYSIFDNIDELLATIEYDYLDDELFTETKKFVYDILMTDYTSIGFIPELNSILYMNSSNKIVIISSIILKDLDSYVKCQSERK